MQMVLSQLFFSIVWILSWIERQNIVEVQIWQILAVTLAGKTISLRFDITVCYPSSFKGQRWVRGVWILCPQTPEPWSVVNNMNPGTLEGP